MRKLLFSSLFVVTAALGTAVFLYAATPLAESDIAVAQSVIVTRGEGAREVASELVDRGIIRSASGFYMISLMTGSAFSIKPGTYEFSNDMGARKILDELVEGPDIERTVTVWEGATIYDIDALLADAGVFGKGDLIAFDKTLSSRGPSEPLEGYLFPDTYRFYVGSSARDVVDTMKKNFEAKARPFLPKDPDEAERILIMASILEKEIPEPKDRQIVEGILEKRLKKGVALQVDASVCYAKEIANQGAYPCVPLKTLDFTRESPYNTYLRKGLPPHPIANPGTEALLAARAPLHSPYWFYLSDPATKKTIFAVTLDEHNRNRVKYLK